ncbi:MAG: HNH endonuclease [Ktedonobacterales bacterium]
MSVTHISVALRREVVGRADSRCEYCGVPEDTRIARHEPDHIIGEQHGGVTSLDNLGLPAFAAIVSKARTLRHATHMIVSWFRSTIHATITGPTTFISTER